MSGSIVIEELSIPVDQDAASFADYARTLAVRNDHESRVMGPAARIIDPAGELPSFRDQANVVQRIFAGRLDGEIVAHGLLRLSMQPGTLIAWTFGEVLPHARRCGVGTALFDELEHLASGQGRTVVQSFAMQPFNPGEERLPSPTGFGSLSLHDPGVRFLRGRGYELGQIQRLSLLHLPIPSTRLDVLHRESGPIASDYEVVTWVGPTSEGWLADLAVLFSCAEADAPRGALANEPEAWDVARVCALEAKDARSGRSAFTAAAVFRPTGRLAGVTRLSTPPDRKQVARQHTTIVLPEHRGHRLGLRMKLANLQQVTQALPDSITIVTGNAEDNRYMLNVNEALGFVPIACGGAWKKTLA